MTSISPYGSWTSPITASDLAGRGLALGFPDLVARPGDRPVNGSTCGGARVGPPSAAGK